MVDEAKKEIRQTHKYKADDIVKLVMKKKVPLLVRHGVAAIYEGTYRYIKHTKRGAFRTKERIPVSKRQVTKTKQGVIDAFNIIMGSFRNYGFLARSTPALTGKGRKQNSLHLRETDSRRRTMLFNKIFKKHFSKEITAYEQNK